MPRIWLAILLAGALAAGTIPAAADDAKPRQKVLLVVDQLDNDQLNFLKAALSPDEKLTNIAITVEKPEFLASAKLDEYASIYAFDVKRFSMGEHAALEKFATAGGGVCFFTGPRVDVNYYNKSLFADGEGIFPLPLAGEVELKDDDKRVVAEDHPVLAEFRGESKPLLDVIVVTRCLSPPKDWKLEKDSPVRVIARSAGGNPLVVEKPHGKGRVAAVLLVPARGWTSWHFYPTWVMFLHELQSHLTAGRMDG